jgi:hypothetical protein
MGIINNEASSICLSRVYWGLIFAVGVMASESPLASEEEVNEALGVLEAWTAAFISGDYREQWQLTDKRITRWISRSKFRKVMDGAQKFNGDLERHTITGAAPAIAADLPCSEMGHCYREGVQYVLITIASEYEKAAPPQPEFVVMAKSEEGWRFGGGSFLNRPMGETAVIMTEHDERRYKPHFPNSQ